MPLITTSHDSLPYIDPEPTPSQRALAQSLIDAELSLVDSQAQDLSTEDSHPLLPPAPSTKPTELMAQEYTRLSAKRPFKGGIDLSRYESLSSDAGDVSSSLLSQAYTSSVYLNNRQAQLSSLSETGKDAWLSHNDSLSKILASIEKELLERKEEIDGLAVERQRRQEEVKGEILGLERDWRKGVGRVVEVEVAGEGVREEILEKRRALGGGTA